MGEEKKGVPWGVGIGKVKVQQENFRGHRRLSQSPAANFKGLGTKYPEPSSRLILTLTHWQVSSST